MRAHGRTLATKAWLFLSQPLRCSGPTFALSQSNLSQDLFVGKLYSTESWLPGVIGPVTQASDAFRPESCRISEVISSEPAPSPTYRGHGWPRAVCGSPGAT